MGLFSGIIGGLSSLASFGASRNAARAQQAALAQAAQFANQGQFNNFGFFGPGGVSAGFNPLTGTSTFGLGNLQGLSDQFADFGAQSLSQAQDAGVPGVTQGLFAGLGNVADQAPGVNANFFSGLQGQLGGALDLAGQGIVDASQASPGVAGDAFSGARGLLSDASQGGSQVVSDRLSLLRQQAQPFEDRAFSSLQNNLFNTGRLGTSGGALQTEAFARGLGQADLSRQLAASEEGRRFTSDALGRAGGLFNIGAQDLSLSDSLVNNAFSRFGNFAGLASDVERGRFGQALSSQQNLFNQGQGLFDNSVRLAGLPAALQGANLQNALSSLGGTQSLFNLPLNAFNTALGGASALQGNAPFAGAPQDVLAGAFSGLSGAAQSGGLDNFFGSIFGRQRPLPADQAGIFLNGGLVF